MKTYKLLLVVLVMMSLFSCSSDTDNSAEVEDTESDEVETYILVEVTNGGGVYLINQDGEEVYNFDLNYTLGNDANLEDDGSLVAIVKSNNTDITFGGYGGKFIKQNADKSIEWEVEYASSEYNAHHDVETLPNGNILFPVWEKVSADDATAAGFSGGFDIYPESIVEMDPLTQEVVWQWRMMDHVIQDHDSAQANFGVVANNPRKIDLNYNNSQTDGDITHANGLTYDEENDLIYMTVNYYSEVWVIDHSTTTTEAATEQGGDQGLGGDLVYRFGNPEVYDNEVGEVTLNRVHYPNLLDNGNVLVFANQLNAGQSEAIEFDLPDEFSLEVGVDNEPTIAWSFTDENLYSGFISSAVRMDNGNTLIAEGVAGTLWEVSDSGEIIWQYQIVSENLWRAYVFSSDSSAIQALDIE
ncbi:MAG: aryl-sulfate sulfotransferase [Paraglaciecola sp.]|uniref:aryl-sulfate sulfotransferase n=1 Tax=Paraglaciecola sp. TaxID=1920173 RepID=UPI003263DB8C